MMRTIICFFAVGFFISLAPGCKPGEGPGAEPPPLIRSQLKQIALNYFSFGDVNKGKAPAKLEDLHPYFHAAVFPPELGKADQECYQAIKDEKYGVVWGAKDFHGAKDGTKLILAYEARAIQTGGFVVFADLRIEWMNADQLEESIKEMPKQQK